MSHRRPSRHRAINLWFGARLQNFDWLSQTLSGTRLLQPPDGHSIQCPLWANVWEVFDHRACCRVRRPLVLAAAKTRFWSCFLTTEGVRLLLSRSSTSYPEADPQSWTPQALTAIPCVQTAVHHNTTTPLLRTTKLQLKISTPQVSTAAANFRSAST